MPFINVKTNKLLTKESMEKIKSEFGEAISIIPGKSEGWLMVEIEQGMNMWFKGSDDLCAMADVSIYGNAGKKYLESLTEKICEIISNEGISQSRIYVKYSMIEDWGYNGSNF